MCVLCVCVLICLDTMFCVGVRRMPSPFFKAKRRKSDSTLHGELESMPQAGRRTLRGIPSGTRSGVADIKYCELILEIHWLFIQVKRLF